MSSLPHYQDLPNNSVVCLMSPTASGKTDLAFRLYQTGRFELVSVDSALIYQGMNIGTAKPTADELAQFPHHLVDIISPTKTYSVANFVADVERLIHEIHQRGKIPLLVGGTMMYYMALFDGISSVPETDQSVRDKVKAWLDEEGNDAIYQYLMKHDPVICEKLKPTDTQRITRAVEVHLQTGVPMSTWQATPKVALSHDPKWQWYGIVVTPDRAWLHERIERRLEIMWADGFVDEVVGLLNKYPALTADMPSMRCVGYRQVLEYLAVTAHPAIVNHSGLATFAQQILNNDMQKIHDASKTDKKSQKNLINADEVSCKDMKNKALYATRQLAKRQYTWLKQLALMENPTIKHISIASFDSIKQVQTHFLQLQ
ncbi:tRNA (adenosine(37)-N6)-dimethylallyltransferase MiaA [Moraxella sp. FZLJ2107]|uniref:tRNA (adenosine(37)-N6)-dimethylallyltransferase MiaA n=1 Tax=unclassified Moraxella TaxID=2685852 RepID=UPI0020C880C4|nr:MULTISPECIES: tRNA (adenosine(37)-N6)-dimethylallyltransferase MiaA [unclassified Moraxella]UTO05522.1 tRNA (adenosine(37)-N6)-dimethylallyltransferase MiaA [Moraxella sp. FZLJ2107]UTO22258.1 tRNA (adenosine(37)-N6)-dimethylallyltransferase MiaA [Moraxella sp. FZLJ2109]